MDAGRAARARTILVAARERVRRGGARAGYDQLARGDAAHPAELTGTDHRRRHDRRRRAIIAKSTLSFLGLGFPPDIPTWGRILFDAKDYLDIAPHWALFAGGAIFLAVLSINFIGDGLRDALDPRTSA